MKTVHYRKFLLLLIFLCSFFFIPLFFAYPSDSYDEFYSARVKDISDRAYEPAVIELLDNARDSIVMSMYILKSQEKGPVRLLVRDLEEALERGVSVEIYLNTKFKSSHGEKVTIGKPFDILREKGARIYTVIPRYRLHDKVIIVDNRYVVKGSVNWSVSALKDNFESAVLIDSPEVAKSKLIRLKRLPLKGQESRKSERPDRPKKPKALSEGTFITLNKELLYDKNLFPQMITRHDNRSMDTYFLLLAESERWNAKEFFLSLEDIAMDLKMPAKWSDTAMRRQVIKVLRKLKYRYKLIDVNFRHGKDAWIVIRELSGDTFKLKGNFFAPDFLSSKNLSGKYVLLIKALLKAEGKTIGSFTTEEIIERFHVSDSSLYRGLKEIKGSF